MGPRDVVARLCGRFDDPAFTLLFVLFCTQALVSLALGAMGCACVYACCAAALIGVGMYVRASGESVPVDVTFVSDCAEGS